MSLQTLLALVLATGSFAFASTLAPSDPDMFWHLASAKWMVEHGQLLSRDPFSFTARDAPYNVGEWLGQLAFYGAYLAAGWQGIAVLRSLLVAIVTFFAARATLLVQPRPAAAIVPLMVALLISKTTWSDRPQLFTLALFAVFFAVLVHAHREGRASRALWALPPLALVWANLHPGYAVGIGLLALFTVAAFLERRPHARALAPVLVVSTFLTLLSPGTLGLLGAAGHVARPPRFITEELPPDLFTPAGAFFAILLVAALAAALVGGESRGERLAGFPGAPRGRPQAGARGRVTGPHESASPEHAAKLASPTLAWAVILPPLVALGLSAQRHLPIAAIGLAPFVARAVPDALARLWPRLRLKPSPVAAVRPGLATTFIALLALSMLAAVRTAPGAPDESAYPRGALASLARLDGNLLNEYDWGGYLIWNAPEHPAFVDGRLFLFVDSGVLDDYIAATELRPRFQDVLDRWRVRIALLRPARPLAVHLRQSGWRVVAEEAGAFVLLERP